MTTTHLTYPPRGGSALLAGGGLAVAGSIAVAVVQSTSASWLGVAVYGIGYGLLGLAMLSDTVVRGRASTRPV
jgi:hypothetical protein